MKKAIIAILVIVGLVSHSLAQGTVYFSNASSDLPSPPDRLVRWNRYPYAPGEPTPFPVGSPVGSNGIPGLRAQLYYGSSLAPESSLVAVSTAPATFRSSTSPNAGTWFGGTRTLDGFFPGQTVNLEVRVWDISQASSFEAALSLGIFYTSALGESQIFSYTIPNSPFDLQAFNMNNYFGFSIQQPEAVPEPSSTWLFMFGAAAFIGWHWRRKFKA